VLSSGHKCGVSSTFNTKVEEFGSSRASTARQAFPSPSNYPNVSSGVIAGHHPVGVKLPPDSTENSEEPLICFCLSAISLIYLLISLIVVLSIL
jgi:hypothetical protein